MLTFKTKRTLLQILPFGLISLVASVVYNLLEKGILADHPVYPSTGNTYYFRIVVPALISFVIGLLIGLFEVRFFSNRFKGGSLIVKILSKTVLYLLMIVLAMFIIITLSNAANMGVSPFSKEVWDDFTAFFTNFAFISVLIYFAVAIGVCLFFNEVSNNMGQAVLQNFLWGKYHTPKEEERVYMFLDMRSSTTLAEQLGHVKYFKMLNEYYKDLSDPIISYGGEIYQYVGDEVVISWKVKEGFANNCLDCFYAMKNALQKQSSKYEERYHVVPTFKAGIHLGKVTAGEIGVLKKDIVFSGDVLNTTARIQGLCNQYGVDLLASEQFIQALALNGSIVPKELGEVALRGRNEKINIYTRTEEDK